ncbi:PHD finger protein enhancer of yellow 3 isoform X2 [Lasioglossum baleicum]|uniref:PHD finger protein enhancer of yellow 3 isoform X2 n=1 Tax=Lasioglossum baleicum TaxID=434251 RepID=UPI003FCE1B43
MSESAKMGLFGSKDKTQEGKTEAKDDSPDRYAPYCIDSDCETYDTETLSIMDIHDIIGVQSETVSDSTLESEIAALSQIITDSKTDGGQSTAETKPVAEQKDTCEGSDATKSMLDSHKAVGPVKGESTETMDMELENRQESNNVKDNHEHNVSIGSVIAICFNDIENIGRFKHKCTLQTIPSKENVNRTVQSESSICGSLQLIGEAYSSDDSQDTKLDDAELVSKNILMSDEEKKETGESQDAANNVAEISSKILNEISTNKDTPVESISNDAADVEAPTCTAAEKESNISEKIEIHIEATVDNPENVVSESKTEDVTVDAVEMDKMEEQVSEERKESNAETKEKITEEYAKMEVEESAQSEHNPSTSMVEEPEAEVLKENPKSEEPMDVDEKEEHEIEECRLDKNEASQEDKGDTNTSNIGITEKVESAQIESENIVDSTESNSSDVLHSKDNVEEKESETDVQAPEEEGEMDVEKLENKEETAIEKLEAAEDVDTDKLEVMEEINTEQLETAKEMDTKQFKTAEEIDTKQLETTEESAKEMDTKQSEIAEQIDTMQSETAEEVDTKQSENPEEADTRQSEIVEKVDIEQSKAPEEVDTKRSETTEKIDTMQSEATEEVDTAKSETLVEMDFKQSEAVEKMDSAEIVQFETAEKEDTKRFETARETDTEQSEFAKVMDTKESESVEEMTTEQLETVENMDSKQPETAKEIETEQLEAVKQVDTKCSENAETVDPEESEFSEEMNARKLESAEVMDTKQSEPVEETKQSESVEEMDTEKSELLEEIDTKQSEVSEERDTKQSEVLEERDTKQSEVLEEMDIKQSKTTEEMDTKQLEAPTEVDNERSETTEEVDTKQSEITEETKQTTGDSDTKQMETAKEMQQDAEKPLLGELPSSESESPATTELTIETTNIISNAANAKSLEINTNLQTEAGSNLDPILSEIEMKEPSTVESNVAEELPVAEEELKDEVNIIEKSDTTTAIEVPTMMKVNEEPEALPLELEAISVIKISMDTDSTEDSSEMKVDSPQVDSCKVEATDTESLPIKECIPEVENQELTEARNTIENEISEETTVERNEINVSEMCAELEDVKVSTENENILINDEEQSSCKVSVQEEEKMECETTEVVMPEYNDKVRAESLEEFKPGQVKTSVESDANVDNNETEDTVKDKDGAPGLEELLLLPSEYKEPVLPGENVGGEDTGEEMNLNINDMDVESQPEVSENNFEQKVEKTIVIEDDKKKEQVSSSLEKNDVIAEEEIMKIEKQDGLDKDAENIMNLNDTEDSVLNRDVELQQREQTDSNDSKSDATENNFKGILETASTVEEIFSEEQNDNTEDIVTSILDDVRSATDFKNILTTEADASNEMVTALEESVSLPLIGTAIEELAEKLPESSENIMNKEMEDSMSTQNIDSLEGLLGLDLIHEGEDSALKTIKPDKSFEEQETLSKDVDMSLLLQQSNEASDMQQTSPCIADVINSLTEDTVALQENTGNTDLMEVDKPEDSETDSLLKVKESTISESVDPENVQSLQKELEAGSDLPENELDMDFEEAPLDTADELEETKLDLTSDMLLANDDNSETLNNAQSLETSQPSSEISELESAVKFLQESEEQAIDSPLTLSPKMVESVVEDISKQTDAAAIFVPDEDMCEDTELVEELQSIATDSISISEAEIISEAAKLESEKKLAEQVKLDASREQFESNEEKLVTEEIKLSETEIKFDSVSLETMVVQTAAPTEKKMPAALHSLPLKTSETIPKVSILEERLKEPPKIEIPTADVTKVAVSPTSSKDSLLIQKDAKLIAFQKMLESPKLSEKTEPKLAETPRKDSEKHDFENVGSPRIILKIAKSAITDCAEPRSPKSPKIRSATNSPNPEDSPGQKLGKIKLKLSKGGHPSIISNENIEEVGQWYSEGSLSLSPIGMKIKLSKSGDASIVSSDKHEPSDDPKEGKHKFEEAKRTESPIGMKIKLSKSGDASIVQQDSKDIQMKHKDKLDMVQRSPKRTESPIGMKIKLSKSGDASIIPTERQDAPEDHREPQARPKEAYDSPKRTDSPIGMKIKLSRTGDASIVSPDVPEEGRDSKVKDKQESSPEAPKRTDSPIGMKIKLAKTKGGASIIPMEAPEDTSQKLEIPDAPKRTESPLGMKIKLSKTGDASIVHSEVSDESKDIKQQDAPQDAVKVSDSSSMKIKVIKSGDTSVIAPECSDEPEVCQESLQKVESPIGMKIKLSKFGDPSIVPSEKQEQPEESSKLVPETPKRTESPIGMKIKLSKTGDASIIQPEVSNVEDVSKASRSSDAEHPKGADSALGMKIKLLKTGDASIVDPEKKERQPRRRETESPLEMKIKLSKTGHPTIVACDNHGEASYRPKEHADQHSFGQRYKEQVQTHKESALKFLKTGHPTILQGNRSELTIEPVQMQGKKSDSTIDIAPKRKDITVSPIEPKKSKLETQLTQILPEVTIQPVTSRNQKQFMFDPKSSAISLQQMNVISQEISITQVRPSKTQDTSMTDKLKDMLNKNSTSSPMNSDCEIIEHRPELIIVNENSNSSQDVVIIEEVSPARMPEVKVPKRRGRPRRNPLAQPTVHPPSHMLMSGGPLSLNDPQQMQQHLQAPQVESRENERPKRTCRNQKSYAPPKRGRGRGRGKRKLDSTDIQTGKKPKIEQDLTVIEASTTAVITIDCPPGQDESPAKPSELYKALKQPAADTKIASTARAEKKAASQKLDASKIPIALSATLPDSTNLIAEASKQIPEVDLEPSNDASKPITNESKDNMKDKKPVDVVSEKMQKTAPAKQTSDEKSDKTMETAKSENKDTLVPPGPQNWLTPTSKRVPETTGKQNENVSTVQVIDEETRMSAESGSRSQTPARNISAPASETMVNEESQGSVLSTATTESEKVKVKNRRMEINFDPDEGPFTVDKIAEYEWPLDRKGETFMIQEQISQYLGVKSFKRKYPDLKRRVVDMEERNYLRENGLVSEAMCDMGLTAICSSEVLDVMCSDFPDQYEEYRKHMREKQVKEHSKKQKELSAAANAEKNRIDLAEMAVQSALSWNISLNKARRENRKCSLDLQTFTIHVPKKQQKVEAERKIGHYPVALIPGQYTDYYREYTPAELRYYPLNTVLYGPMRPNERKFDSQSEGSQSDSDSDSSSDDSSEGTQDTEGSQSTMDDVDMEVVAPKDEVKLKCKMCLKVLNKNSKNEVLVQCGTCSGHVHPSCIDLTLDMVPHIQSYAWQCTDCKTCAQCHDPADEDKMLFCDMCDRGYHIYCVGLRRVPQGRWHCQECAVCANCGSREPGGANSDRNSVAQWQHEYKKGDKNTRVYVSTLCVPCSKLWRKGRYCPHCSRCHTAPRLDLEANLVHCSACDKYLHLGCVETKGVPLDRKNYLCDFCAPNRQHMVKPLVSKTMRT